MLSVEFCFAVSNDYNFTLVNAGLPQSARVDKILVLNVYLCSTLFIVPLERFQANEATYLNRQGTG